MANKWFNETFLPSLFTRAGVNNPLWISHKQEEICRANMHTARSCYACEWDGRTVQLYVTRNGVARICFCETLAERYASSDKYEENAAKKAYSRDRAEWERRIAEIKMLLDDIAEDLSDGLITPAIAKRDSADLEKKLAIWQAAAG